MMCESAGVPEAHNYNPHTKDNSIGLFQINLWGELAKERPSVEWLKNPVNNISYSYELWKKEGWNPWSCGKLI